MKLANRTRGGSPPEGRPRVYFTAHPEDYDLLDAISGDILKQQDCAVYYDTEPGEVYCRQELYGNLEMVQLLVFPVTEKLLQEENRTLEVEYAYAIRHHIPVLPFMQKRGLEDSLLEEGAYFGKLAGAFNERLGEQFSRRRRRLSGEMIRRARAGRAGRGIPRALSGLPKGGRRLKENGEVSARYRNLQMLNAYDKDPTAIPYEEKLRKFLASVLVSDELAERVREAFDAYIFLSYRKKDREHANKLMKLIHQNEFCRDIAIWFDEFLVPGESFSRAIEEAMEKSSLFAFAITPNVLEEPNYVKDEEYVRARKDAREKGKVLFPVELVPVRGPQEEELREKFQGLPECVDAVGDMTGKWEHFSEELLIAVRRAGIRLGKGTLEHNFLIGLAYMNGIDVEKDSIRGLKLIRDAADKGLGEAVSELVNLYSTGKGVDLDYRKASVWQERKVGRLRKEFEERQGAETAESLIEALTKLGDCRYSMRDLEGANSAYEEMERILLKSWDFYEGKSIPVWHLAEYYSKMARGMYSAGLLELAEGYTKKYGECAGILKDHGMLLEKQILLGNIRRRQGRAEEAEKEYREAYELAWEMYESGRGVTEENRKDPDISRALRDKERAGRRNLVYCCNMLGRISAEQGRPGEAIQYYGRMLEMCLRLQEEEKTPKSWEDLALAYAKMGDASASLNHLEDAGHYIRKACEIYEALYKKYGTMEVKRGLSLTYERLGDLCMKRQKPDEAMEFYQQYFTLSSQLYEQTL